MFEMRNSRTREVVMVYAIHKSGPQDVQTKFLVWSGAWKWDWATSYEPLERVAAWSPRDSSPIAA